MDDSGSLAQAALSSAKYRHVEPGLARTLAAAELRKRTPRGEAVKVIRSKLHQVACSFQRGSPRYGQWLAELQAAAADPAMLRAVCRRIMAHHASTNERLPLLDRFYREVLPAPESIHSVLDAGCGLHPLAIPFMGLPPGVHYFACDVLADLADFLSAVFPLLGVDGRTGLCDVSSGRTEPADVAFFLKLLPVLEQLRPGASQDLLAGCEAPRIVVSFPLRTLGGRRVGMARNYERWFMDLPAVGRCQVQRLEFPGELVFVLLQ